MFGNGYFLTVLGEIQVGFIELLSIRDTPLYSIRISFVLLVLLLNESFVKLLSKSSVELLIWNCYLLLALSRTSNPCGRQISLGTQMPKTSLLVAIPSEINQIFDQIADDIMLNLMGTYIGRSEEITNLYFET